MKRFGISVCLSIILMISLVSTPSLASIISVSGNAAIGNSTGLDLTKGQTESTVFMGFDEQQCLALTDPSGHLFDHFFDPSMIGVTRSGMRPVEWLTLDPGIYSSHNLHFDPPNARGHSGDASFEFDQPIVAIQYKKLQPSDPTFGDPTATYGWRRMEGSNDYFTFDSDRRLTLNVGVAQGNIVSMRVITECPTAGYDVCPDGSCEYSNIQQAITDASSGDTVTVGPGTYLESDLVINKDLTLVGAGLDITTIDAQQAARVLKVWGNVTVSVSGLTLTGGSEQLFQGGGGLYVKDATVHLANCRVSNSRVSGNIPSGGIAFRGSAIGTIDSCWIDGNTSNLEGAGLRVYGSADVTVTNTLFENNAAGTQGGGASADGSSVLSISGSTFSGNTAGTAGAALAARGSSTITVSSSSLAGDCTADGSGTVSDGGGNTGNCF